MKKSLTRVLNLKQSMLGSLMLMMFLVLTSGSNSVKYVYPNIHFKLEELVF